MPRAGVFGVAEMRLGLMRILFCSGVTQPGLSYPGETFSGRAKTTASKTPVKGTPALDSLRAT